MNLKEFEIMTRRKIIVEYNPIQRCFYCFVEKADFINENGINLLNIIGKGDTAPESVHDYVKLIKGKRFKSVENTVISNEILIPESLIGEGIVEVSVPFQLEIIFDEEDDNKFYYTSMILSNLDIIERIQSHGSVLRDGNKSIDNQ